MFAIDTSSLQRLVDYYLPFDVDKTLFNFIKSKVKSGEIIVIDKVFEQASYIQKGYILSKLPFLKEKVIATTELLPDRQFTHFVNNDFVNSVVRKNLSDAEFEVRKSRFLEDADAKLLLYCKKSGLMKYKIITEETETSNDNKEFKKIPAMCKTLDLGCITLPQYLELAGITITFKK